MTDYRNLFNIVHLACLLLFLSSYNVVGQDKNRVRISADYSAQMPDLSTIEMQARFRGESGFEPAIDMPLEIYNVYPNDSLVAIGSVKTNSLGKASFTLPERSTQYQDSLGLFTYRIIHHESDLFREAERSLSFKIARLDTYIVEENGVSNLKATLTDLKTGKPIVGTPVRVGVQRLFGPLIIGGDFNMTDEEGSILVPIDNDIPGVHGNLVFEAQISDDEVYGTVISTVEAPLGLPIVDRSTFDERTLWGPPSMAPMFLLIVANLLILGVWGTIVYLFINLYKISKS